MATVRKRTTPSGKVRWQVRWWTPEGHQASETFDSEKKAKTLRGLIDANGQRLPAGYIKGQGFAPATTSLSVGAWCARAVAARSGIEARTRHDYARQLELHLGDLAAVALADLSREQVSAWVVSLKRSPKTIKNLHGLLSSCLTDAVRDGLIARNPAEGIGLPRLDGPGREDITPLSTSDVALLIANTDAHYQPLVQLLAGTGMRWSEATGLQARHVDPFACRVSITQAWKRQPDSSMAMGSTKTRRSRRSLAITEALRDALVPLLSERAADAYLFQTPSGKPVRNSNFRDRVWLPAIAKAQRCEAHKDEPKACGCAGTLRVTPHIHDLRHFHASYLIAAGVPLVKIQRRLGHESIKTTVDVYGHLMPDSDDEVIGALERASLRIGHINTVGA